MWSTPALNPVDRAYQPCGSSVFRISCVIICCIVLILYGVVWHGGLYVQVRVRVRVRLCTFEKITLVSEPYFNSQPGPLFWSYYDQCYFSNDKSLTPPFQRAAAKLFDTYIQCIMYDVNNHFHQHVTSVRVNQCNRQVIPVHQWFTEVACLQSFHVTFLLTHLPLVPQIGVSESGQLWFR